MKASQKIDAEIKAKIKREAETIADPQALYEAARKGDYWWAQISAATGADQFHAREKITIGYKGPENTSPEKYAQYSRPMTAENFPGNAYDWEQASPKGQIIDKLDEKIEDLGEMHWIVGMYLEHAGRFPDPEGFQLWINLLIAGHSENTVRGWILNGFSKAE